MNEWSSLGVCWLRVDLSSSWTASSSVGVGRCSKNTCTSGDCQTSCLLMFGHHFNGGTLLLLFLLFPPLTTFNHQNLTAKFEPRQKTERLFFLNSRFKNANLDLAGIQLANQTKLQYKLAWNAGRVLTALTLFKTNNTKFRKTS